LIEKSFDESRDKGDFLLRRCTDELWVSLTPREAHLRFASIPIQYLQLLQQGNALDGTSIHLLLHISHNGDAFLRTNWASRRRNIMEGEPSPSRYKNPAGNYE
jgi:hypothetical protein